jgi:malate dehydrogenase
VRHKITVIGAGYVGGTLAQRLADRDYADIVLVDIVPGLPQGKALDILQAGPVVGFDSHVIGTNGYEETAGSDVVVVTGGIARKTGMSRDDLLMINAGIVAGVVRQAAAASPEAVLIMVSNPLDAMAQVALAVSGFPRKRVIGMAGILDTARFRAFVAQELGASVRDVQAMVLGGHGDTMVPLTQLTTVAGVPIAQLIAPERLEQIVQRTRNGGAEIVGLIGITSAYQAPSAAVAQMVDAILLDTRQILPCSIHLEGEYGINGVFSGVPARLGTGGLVEVVEVDLAASDRAALVRSAASVEELVGVIERNRDQVDKALPSLLGIHSL